MTKVIIVTTVIEKVIKVFNANFEKGDPGTRTMTNKIFEAPSGWNPKLFPTEKIKLYYLLPLTFW